MPDIVLPLAHGPAEQKNHSQPFSQFIKDDRHHITAKDKTLLVIDDDKTFAMIISNYARKSGYKCVVAGDGRSGIYLAQVFQPQGIILDLGLPDIDGQQVLQQLKASASSHQIPVQVISASDDAKNKVLVQGAIGFLNKPVNEGQLREVLSDISCLAKTEVKNILLIEDDQDHRKATARLLKKKGINLKCVGTGKDGCRHILSGKYHCVILDLGLPDMSGFQVLETINNSELKTIPPVIIYTGKELNDKEQALLERYSSTIVVKGSAAAERLLDDVSLFLHDIGSRANKDQKNAAKLLQDEYVMLKGRKILLIDDDMRDAYPLSKKLIETGFDVNMASSGKEALELLQSDAGYELVLMAIMMPVMDGNEAIKQIRQMSHYHNIPIIALTAKTMPQDRDQCLQAGASEYLTKPINFAQLLSIIRIWLFKHG